MLQVHTMDGMRIYWVEKFGGWTGASKLREYSIGKREKVIIVEKILIFLISLRSTK